MIWIASYPRSGNTFLRNLFYDVFGLESTSYPRENKHNNNITYQVTKTHALPSKIPEYNTKDFTIYLVRDGRDSIVSNSHFRKNFDDPLAVFDQVTEESILAKNGSHFGGWSHNVHEWSMKADIIIRFEELIKDPELWLRKIANKVDLPIPDYSQIKTFSELKNGTPKYGSGAKTGDQRKFASKFFRSGQIGASKSEMPEHLQRLFWLYHGDVMLQMGYSKDGSLKEFKTKRVKRKRTTWRKAQIKLLSLKKQ